MLRINKRTIRKDLHYPDNHNGVITHLEPDILECEVKWALGSITMNKASGGSFTISWSLLKFIFIESVMLSNHLILCRTLLLLPSIFPSCRFFSSESTLHIRWPRYWSFGISPSNKYSGLVSIRIDWFDLLAVWGSLKSLLQHHS